MDKRFHVNPNTGNPGICRAKYSCKYAVDGVEPPHYKSSAEASAAYEKQQQQKTFSNTTNVKNPLNSSKQRLKREKLLANLAKSGVKAGFYSDCALEFYHESDDEPPSKIQSFNANNQKTFSRVLQKPQHVLWLSPGIKSSTGKVTTSWSEWTTNEDFMVPKTDHVHKAVINNNAVIIELNETTVKELADRLEGKTINDDTKTGDALGYSFGGMRIFNDGTIEYNHTLPWDKLKDAGVDLVRVNGYSNRDTFYGWDCDSMIVLNGAAVEGWEECQAERSLDNINKAWENNYKLELLRDKQT